jgi:heme-degrading monooxygenase HmoA
MFARVTTVQGSPNRMDEGIRYFQEQVVPTVVALEGFQGAYLLINRTSGKTVRITFWETTEAEQASAAVVAQIRREGAEVLRDWRDPLPEQPVVEMYEVVVKVSSEC